MSNEKEYKSFSEYLKSDEIKNYYEEIDKAINNYKKEAEDFFNNLDEENKIKCFMHVVGKIVQSNLIDQGSYRHLLYDVMGFDTSTYGLGMDFGLMELHNSIYSYDDLEDNLKKLLNHLNIEYDKKSLYKYMKFIQYGYYNDLNVLNNKQLKFDFGDKDAIQ